MGKKEEIHLHPFAAVIWDNLANQSVEIHIGDVRTVMLQAESELHLKNVIRGILVEAVGDALILQVGGTKVFVNVWGVKTVVPMAQRIFTDDVFVDEHEGLSEMRK